MSHLYAVLGVDPGVDQSTIRQAYRRLAYRHHPDSGGDERQMMRINDAWHTLGHQERRAAYDATREQPTARGRQTRHGSTVLDFGRYDGWSLAEVAQRDDNYLEWLARTPIGRPLRSEISELLAAHAGVAVASRSPVHRPVRRWGRR